MNETHPIPSSNTAGRLSHHQLHVWHRARELVRLVHGARIQNAELRDQASRASLSVALNISEGAALNTSKSKRRHYAIARGSTIEVVAAYELAADVGESVPTVEIQRLGATIARMLTGLLR